MSKGENCMRKSKWFMSVGAMLLTAVLGVSLVGCVDTESYEKYSERVNGFKVGEENLFANDIADILPQTMVYKLIEEHYNAPLPEGKTIKKVLFMGYDGFRADGLENVKDLGIDKSAIMNVREQGGLYLNFAGGVKGVNKQATSTAPGWAAMLTGGWGEYNGIVDNGMCKKADVDTILTKLAREKGVECSFTTSWREHTKVSYFEDIVQAKQERLPIEYTHNPDSEAVLYQVLEYVARPNVEKAGYDPDVLFFTLEQTDGAGHGTNFGNKNQNYIEACREIDDFGMRIMNTIYNRETYDEEDWLFIVTTDHGGNGKSHGGQSAQERTTWLAVNKVLDVESYKDFALTK